MAVVESTLKTGRSGSGTETEMEYRFIHRHNNYRLPISTVSAVVFELEKDVEVATIVIE